VGAIVALLIIGLGARLSFAHADYDRSVPAADAVVATAPPMVEIWFTQEIDESGTVIRVIGPDGSQVDLGDTTLDLFDPNRKRVTVSLTAELSPEIYTVEWTSLSAEDGEADEGSFTFTVACDVGTPGASPEASPAVSPESSSSASPMACS